jgi:tetratricopeptide (TPR) repeat protein
MVRGDMRPGSTRLQAAAVCVGLVLVAGCPKQPKFGMEAPGRPAITWQHEDGGSSEKRNAQAEKETERELLAEYRAAERKGTDDLAMAQTLYRLAILRRQQGELGEAERLYLRALAIREKEQGSNHPDVAATLNNLAGLKAAQGNYEAAQPLLERALAIRETAFGSDDVLTAESLNNLALLYAAQGNAQAAEPLYQRAVAILEQKHGSQKGELDRVLDNYAALLYETGRDSEAEEMEAHARVIRAAEGQKVEGQRTP